MNRGQKQLVALGIIVFAAMGVYPPWRGETTTTEQLPGRADLTNTSTTFSGNYSFIFSPPPATSGVCTSTPIGGLDAVTKSGRAGYTMGRYHTEYRLDLERLGLQWAILLGVLAGCFALLRDRTGSAPPTLGTAARANPAENGGVILAACGAKPPAS